MKKHIMVVDDSKTIRNLVAFVLKGEGFKVSTAEDGLDAIEKLYSLEPVDLIVSDVNMPRLDGFGFIEAVRKIDRLRATPILMLTTESAPELKARARNAGATGWIVKPFDPQKLVGSLHMVTG